MVATSTLTGRTYPSLVGTRAGSSRRQSAKTAAPAAVVEERPRLLRWWRELALVAILYIAYDVSRGLRGNDVDEARSTGHWLLNAEAWLHINVERSLNAAIGHVPALAVIASYFYATLHFVVTPAVLIWLYRRHPGRYTRARTGLAIATILGLVVFWLLPTAPPRLLPGAHFTDTMATVSGWGWWGHDGSAPRGLGGLTNQLAAMPSLHVGWALWCGYWIFRFARRRWVRWLGISYPVLTTLVVMSTANHYLLDAAAGVLDIAICGWLVGEVAKRRRARVIDVTDRALGETKARLLAARQRSLGDEVDAHAERDHRGDRTQVR